MHNYCTPHIVENFENFLIHRCNYILLSKVYCLWQVVKTPTVISNNPVLLHIRSYKTALSQQFCVYLLLNEFQYYSVFILKEHALDLSYFSLYKEHIRNFLSISVFWFQKKQTPDTRFLNIIRHFYTFVCTFRK
jgi:hypothetical protein